MGVVPEEPGTITVPVWAVLTSAPAASKNNRSLPTSAELPTTTPPSAAVQSQLAMAPGGGVPPGGTWRLSNVIVRSCGEPNWSYTRMVVMPGTMGVWLLRSVPWNSIFVVAWVAVKDPIGTTSAESGVIAAVVSIVPSGAAV